MALRTTTRSECWQRDPSAFPLFCPRCLSLWYFPLPLGGSTHHAFS